VSKYTDEGQPLGEKAKAMGLLKDRGEIVRRAQLETKWVSQGRACERGSDCRSTIMTFYATISISFFPSFFFIPMVIVLDAAHLMHIYLTHLAKPS
jgi:hypothetical protein